MGRLVGMPSRSSPAFKVMKHGRFSDFGAYLSPAKVGTGGGVTCIHEHAVFEERSANQITAPSPESSPVKPRESPAFKESKHGRFSDFGAYLSPGKVGSRGGVTCIHEHAVFEQRNTEHVDSPVTPKKPRTPRQGSPSSRLLTPT